MQMCQLFYMKYFKLIYELKNVLGSGHKMINKIYYAIIGIEYDRTATM